LNLNSPDQLHCSKNNLIRKAYTEYTCKLSSNITFSESLNRELNPSLYLYFSLKHVGEVTLNLLDTDGKSNFNVNNNNYSLFKKLEIYLLSCTSTIYVYSKNLEWYNLGKCSISVNVEGLKSLIKMEL